MLTAPDIKDILSKVQKDLEPKIVSIPKIDTKMTLTTPVTDINKVTQFVEEKIQAKPKMITIVFSQPDSIIGSQLIKYMDRYNVASENHTDFYFAGYGMYWNKKQREEYERVDEFLGIVGKKTWLYSNTPFYAFIDQMKEFTNNQWKYSGETDFITITARPADANHKTPYLDLKHTLSFCMEEMLRNRENDNLERFMQRIVAFTKDYTGDNPVYDFSDKEGMYLLKDSVWSFLPSWFKDNFEKSRHAATKDLSKK